MGDYRLQETLAHFDYCPWLGWLAGFDGLLRDFSLLLAVVTNRRNVRGCKQLSEVLFCEQGVALKPMPCYRSQYA